MIVCEFDIFEVGRDDPIAPDEFKKVLPTKAQLAQCVFAAELMFFSRRSSLWGMGNGEWGTGNGGTGKSVNV